MKMSRHSLSLYAGLALSVMLAGGYSGAVAANDPGGFVGGVYRPDVRFPEFMPMWREGWNWKDETGQKVRYAYEAMPLGGYLYAYIRNTTDRPIIVGDVLMEGVSLSQAVAPEHEVEEPGGGKYASSLAYSKLPSAQIERLTTAGEPVWWKVEPRRVPPGRMCEITVRLRRNPQRNTLEVTVPIEGGMGVTGRINVRKRQPQFASIGFSPVLDTVYVYLRHPSGEGVVPDRIFIDGQDVTDHCTIARDRRMATVPVVIRLREPFAKASFHVFQADYADGTRAMACLGAWYMDFPYGMWGYIRKGDTPKQRREYYLNDMLLHNINVLMYSLPAEAVKYLNTKEGAAFARKVGLYLMSTAPGNHRNTLFYFLTDEPDAADFMSKKLDPRKRIGSMAQWLVARAERFREKDPKTPNLLNVDNTFKPENWYTYAQLPDIACADPYYLGGVQSVLHGDPGDMAAYVKPTYVYGVGTIYQSACAPNPMHLILHTCRFDLPPERTPLRGPTPIEKRIEVYYALATGAKQLSYWWYTPYGEYYGCGGSDPDMVALWTEIGLLGAEVRTVGELLQRACPAEVPVEATRWLWTRSLIAGDDTIVLLVVNDNHFSDRLGTVIRPIENATMRVTLPAWLKPAAVFEVNHEGTAKVDWQASGSGRLLMLNLGTVEVTRMILITARADLRDALQKRYEDKFADNVRKLLAVKRK